MVTGEYMEVGKEEENQSYGIFSFFAGVRTLLGLACDWSEFVFICTIQIYYHAKSQVPSLKNEQVQTLYNPG